MNPNNDIDITTSRWVFSAIVATTRQLRLRRNLVKLSVYKHFANTLVFSIISSIIFMLWSIKYHKVVDCLTQWKDLWIDEVSKIMNFKDIIENWTEFEGILAHTVLSDPLCDHGAVAAQQEQPEVRLHPAAGQGGGLLQ